MILPKLLHSKFLIDAAVEDQSEAHSTASLHQSELNQTILEKKPGQLEFKIHRPKQSRLIARLIALILHPDSNIMTISVPPIVDETTWRLAESQRIKNKLDAERNRINEYLLSKRVICGQCKHRMAGGTVYAHGRHYQYYKCRNATAMPYDIITKCQLPMFRADVLDGLIWNKVVQLLTDPDALMEGFNSYQENCEKKTTPLKERLQVVEDLLDDNQGQLSRLLDLYISGTFSKELLLDRQKRLETTIHALELERITLTSSIQQHTLTDEKIRSIQEFAANISSKLLDHAPNFQARRQLIEMLGIEVTLTVEEGQKIAYLQWLPEPDAQLRLPIQPLLLASENTTSHDALAHTKPTPSLKTWRRKPLSLLGRQPPYRRG